MIRPFLRYIAAPLLDSLGPVVVRAARQALDDADAAQLNEARAIGERDEAREQANRAAGRFVDLAHDLMSAERRAEKAEGEIATLRSELDSAAADDEANMHDRAALADAIKERAELRARCGELAAKAVDDGALILALQSSEVNAARVVGELRARIRDLKTQLDARADVAPVEAKPAECAWCLGATNGECYVDAESTLPLCQDCYVGETPTCDDIRARVLQRANCCASRRTAAYPLDVVCALGCGADVGEECHPGREPAATDRE